MSGENRKENRTGTLYAIASALVFGLTPILASMSYDLGSNAITMTFYRNAMAVPVILAILLFRRVSLKVSLKEFLSLAGVGLFNLATMLLLYDAYNYIGVGLSTTLHFLYPICTVALGFICFRKKPGKLKIFALLLATAGVVMATGQEQSFALKGIVLALLSALTYAAYMIGVEQTGVKNMNSMKAMLYMCAVNTVCVFLIDIPVGDIVYGLSAEAMIYTFIVAVSNSAIAHVLLIKGIKFIGAGNAAVFSMLEPVSGVIGGIFFLGEGASALKLVSCAVILTAVMIPILADRKGADG